jgi:hypothetical protein
MTHDELRDRLLDLAYGELSPRDAREVEAHAASCEACRAELARIRGTRQAMSALPVEPAPARGEGILLAAAREAAGRRTRARSPIPRWLWRGALVAVPVAAVVAVSFRLVVLAPRERAERDALAGEVDAVIRIAPSAPAPQASSPPPAKAAREAGLSRRDELAYATPPSPAPAEEKAAPRHAAPAPQASSASAPAPVPAPAPAPEPRDEARAEQYAAAPSAPPPASADVRQRAMAKAPPPAAAGGVASAPGREGTPPRQRAIDAAIAHATRLSDDARSADVDAGEAPVQWKDWVGASSRTLAADGVTLSRALEGRTFWIVTFSRPGWRGEGLKVFVEDGTFRVLGDERAR